MSWFRVDDSFTDHPKVRAIPRADRKAAVGLWTLAGSYAARQLTDGFIFTDDVIDLGCATKDANALVRSGLWHAHGHDCERCAPVAAGQYLFHDWLIYQRSRERVLAERAAATERQRIARERAKSQRDKGVTHDETQAAVTVPPTRPDPTPSLNELGGERPEPLRAVDATKPPPNHATPADARCTGHQGVAEPGPCRGCGAERERAERKLDRANEAIAREAETAARNCRRCDGVHLMNEDGSPSRRKCDHRRAS